MRSFRSWLKLRIQTFSLLPDYFGAIAKQWINILFGETLVAVIFLLWWALGNPPLVLIFVSAMFVAGYYAWQAEHVRLQQKIEVTRVRTHSWPHRDGGEGIQYYFEIINASEAATIQAVRVQLQEIIPGIENQDWFPIPLHLQHDTSGVTQFDLHPSEPRNIDLFTTVIGSNVARIAHIAHIVAGVDLRVPITGRRRFKIMVTAKDIPVLFVWFNVWIDESGVLRCEMEKNL